MEEKDDKEIQLRNKMTLDRLTPIQQKLITLKGKGYAWADIGFEVGMTKEKARAEYLRTVKHVDQVGKQVANLRKKDIAI